MALQTELTQAAGHARSEYGDLVCVLVNSRSSAEAALAASILRLRVPDAHIVSLCNLRELLSEIASTPLVVPERLEMLGRLLGYQRDGDSWSLRMGGCDRARMIEFIGDGNRVDTIVLHAGDLKIPLTGVDSDFHSTEAAQALLADTEWCDGLLEALSALGLPVTPRFYMSVNDYMSEHAGAALSDIKALF